MKTLVILLVLIAIAEIAQTSIAQNTASTGAFQAAWNKNRLPRTMKDMILNGHIFRRVDGQICNMKLQGEFISGDVDRLDDKGIAIVRYGDVFIAIKHSNASAPNADPTPNFLINGKRSYVQPFVAIKTGVYMSGDVALDLYDCGEMLPEDEEKVQMEAWEKVQMQADQSRAWTEAEAMKPFTNLESLAWISINAASGDAFAQFCLGEHYMRGDGSRTNIILAIRWFTIAAAHGSLEASNQLVELSNPK